MRISADSVLDVVDQPTHMSDEELRKNIEAAIETKVDPRETQEVTVEDGVVVEVKKRTSKKRRCANCTCRRSKDKGIQDGCEVTETVKNGCEVVEEKPTTKSGCGSCYLGDAFRCDGCPYKGMPAFKEGEEFKFDENLNDM